MNISTLGFQTNRERQTRQETYLRIQINPQTQAVIAMKQMQEVLSIPVEKITPLPNVPTWIVGLLNQRSRIFWVMDLPQFLHLSPLELDTSTCNIAVVRVDNHPVGLTIQRVYGVIRLAPETVQSPIGVVASGIEPYLKGCVLHPEGILWVLEPSAMIEAAQTFF